jgi:hypothetical protein
MKALDLKESNRANVEKFCKIMGESSRYGTK